MNEDIIQKLYNQSIVLKQGGMGESEDPADMIRWFDHRKFAECIIKECIQLVEDQYWSDPHEVYEALDLIKNHFGVKE
jgi:hypothetical protein